MRSLWLSQFVQKRSHSSIGKVLTVPYAKRAAIQHQGTVLVKGAAGSGRTKFIVDYIQQAVHKEGVPPSRILCLSPNLQTSYDLQERLDEAGTPFGRNDDKYIASVLHVNFETFESFAGAIFNERCLGHGLPQTQKLLNRYDIWRRYVMNSLFDLDLQEYRPLGEPWSITGNLAQFIRRIYALGLDAKSYQVFAKTIQSDSLDWRQHQVLSNVFSQLEQTTTLSGLYDPSYQISKVSEWFHAEPKIVDRYVGDNFDVIFVDDLEKCSQASLLFLARILSASPNSKLVLVSLDNETLRGENRVSEQGDSGTSTPTALLRDNIGFLESIPATSGHEMLPIHLKPDRNTQTRLDKLILKEYTTSEEEYHGIGRQIERIIAEDAKSSRNSNILVVGSTTTDCSNIYQELKTKYRTSHVKDQTHSWVLSSSSDITANIAGNKGGTGVVPHLMSFLNVVNNPEDTLSLFQFLTKLKCSNQELLDRMGTQIPYSMLGPLNAKAKRLHLNLWNALCSISEQMVQSPTSAAHTSIGKETEEVAQKIQECVDELNFFHNLLELQPSVLPSELVLLYLSRSGLGQVIEEPASDWEINCLEEVNHFLAQLSELESSQVTGECILPTILSQIKTRQQFGMSQLYHRQLEREMGGFQGNSSTTVTVSSLYESQNCRAGSIDHVFMVAATGSNIPGRTTSGLSIGSDVIEFARQYHHQFFPVEVEKLPRGPTFPLDKEARRGIARSQIDHLVSRLKQNGSLQFSYSAHKSASQKRSRQRPSEVICESLEDYQPFLSSNTDISANKKRKVDISTILKTAQRDMQPAGALHPRKRSMSTSTRSDPCTGGSMTSVNSRSRNPTVAGLSASFPTGPMARKTHSRRKPFQVATARPFSTGAITAEGTKAKALSKSEQILHSQNVTDQLFEVLETSSNYAHSTLKHKSRNYRVRDNVLPMSFSSIYEYDWCPKRYLFSREYSLPSPPNPHMIFGSLVHKGIEAFHDVTTCYSVAQSQRLDAVGTAVRATADRMFSLSSEYDTLPGGFIQHSHIDILRTRAEETAVEWARKELEQRASNKAKVLYSEKRFRFLINFAELRGVGVQVAGVWDLVERNTSDGKITIVDYKTNVVHQSKLTRLIRTNALQLGLYAWAYQEMHDGMLPSALALEGVELKERKVLGETTKRKKKQCDPAIVENAIQDAKEMVRSTAKAILDAEFEPTPSRAKCWSCGFSNLCPESVV